MAKLKKKNYIYAVGRRREASARVRLYKGEQENTVNGIVIGKYFDDPRMKHVWAKPFEITENIGKYYVTATIEGGGKRGQLGALTHGISRAFSLANPEKYRAILKKAGLLTRDARIRERRKVGMGGKARRKRQSPKR